MGIGHVRTGPNSATYTAREDGKLIVGEVANVEGNLDRVRRMRHAEIDNGTLGRCYASIPLVTLAAWCNSIGIGMDEAVANDAILDRFLAEHGKFRVSEGWQ